MKLWDDVVRGGMGSYGIVRRTVWYRILQSGTEWYGVVPSGTEWYVLVRSGMGLHEVVRGGTEWYGVVRCGTWRYRMVRGSTERSNSSRIGYPDIYPTCQWWYLTVKEYNIIRKTWIYFFLI